MGKAGLFTAAACLLCFAGTARGQFYFHDNTSYEPVVTWSTGGSAGGMNCLTDLGGKAGAGKPFIRDVNWINTRFCGSWFAQGIWHELIGARAELCFGQVTASDSILKNNVPASYGRYMRNLSFRSDIMEASLVAVFYPMALLRNNNGGFSPFTVYLVGGIGCFSFNPQAKVNNSWISLQPLHTEGQGTAAYPGRHPYQLTQLNVPLGAGITYETASLLSFHAEVIYRKLWTDYLDDVSTTYIDPAIFFISQPRATAMLAAQLSNRRVHPDAAYTIHPGDARGNPKNNDAYFSISLKVALVLGRQQIRP